MNENIAGNKIIEVDKSSIEEGVEIVQGEKPIPKVLKIENKGDTDLHWFVQFPGDLDWLSVDPKHRELEAKNKEDLTIIFSAGQLKPDTYRGTVKISSTDQKVEAVNIPVIMTVVPQPPALNVTEKVEVELKVNQPGDETIRIKNEGNKTLELFYQLEGGEDWLSSTSLRYRKLDKDRSASVKIKFKPGNIPGEYKATILMLSTDPRNKKVEIPIYMKVIPETKGGVVVDRGKEVDLPNEQTKLVNHLLDTLTNIKEALNQAKDVERLETDNYIQAKIQVQHDLVGGFQQFLEQQVEKPNLSTIQEEAKLVEFVPDQVSDIIKQAKSLQNKPPSDSEVQYSEIIVRLGKAKPDLDVLNTELEKLAQVGSISP